MLKSWAVPKGPSFDPKVKRLAMEVEDHPISYATFEGDIPKGNYGAGHVDVFDHGTWQPEGNAREGLKKGDLKFTLHGDMLRGSWVLVRTRRQGTKNQWLLIKHNDGYANPREADDFLDMKKDRPLPPRERKKVWPSESPPKEIGRIARCVEVEAGRQARNHHRRSVRAGILPDTDCPAARRRLAARSEVGRLSHARDRRARQGSLWSRNAIEWTHKLPELVKAIASLKLKSAQLDGEMIVLRDGRDRFQRAAGSAVGGKQGSRNADPVRHTASQRLFVARSAADRTQGRAWALCSRARSSAAAIFRASSRQRRRSVQGSRQARNAKASSASASTVPMSARATAIG